MKYLLILLLLIAPVTMYGVTGDLTASGEVPFVGGLACPREYKLKTKFKIIDIIFVCNDRTNKRLNGRFDLFSVGTRKQMMKWGKKNLEVEILD